LSKESTFLNLKHFQYFKTPIAEIEVPKKFTFPFYYEPHLLCKIASKELQEYLETQTDFEHDFGLHNKQTDVAIGKMFGVLVVENQQKELGYLCAFSGKLADKSLPKKFVPPVFNMRTEGSFYIKGENELNKINESIGLIEENSHFLSLKKLVNTLEKKAFLDLENERQKMKLAKKNRKTRKVEASISLPKKAFDEFNQKLTQESYNHQFYYRELHEHWETKIAHKQENLTVFQDELSQLKKERKKKSNYLQQTLFGKYQFFNQQKELKGLNDIFNNPEIKPPAGSGECAAPKLLNYTFANELKPIAMAEFWWGTSPNSEIRKHKNFYPACQSRCKPILSHMLEGVDLEESKMLESYFEEKELEIIFEDEALIIINKPPEFLSVPGKEVLDSVYTRIKTRYPNATGPLIVHRLDMSTSGILILTKTKESNKIMQRQFINRSVKKRYVALLDGNLQENEGIIKLPLRVDLDDRPRQLVCFTHGKPAETLWKVIHRENGKTRVHFHPITGRTHQLRVHASYFEGLNTPIIGDDLYGKKANRLHLHAEFIEFSHPITNKIISFTVPATF
jgi:tRNA pseudouridine32 synthase/23S rRNA pseudouridine746 synthase